jgi:hypothetical protein
LFEFVAFWGCGEVLKTIVASKAAKAFALCVCPVAGATVALKVPAVRQAIHSATAPTKSHPKRLRIALNDNVDENANSERVCPDPVPMQFSARDIPALPIIESGGVSILPGEAPSGAAGQAFTQAALSNPLQRVSGGRGFQPSLLAPVPEPVVWLQILLGFAAVGTAMRASRRNAGQLSSDVI